MKNSLKLLLVGTILCATANVWAKADFNADVRCATEYGLKDNPMFDCDSIEALQARQAVLTDLAQQLEPSAKLSHENRANCIGSSDCTPSTNEVLYYQIQSQLEIIDTKLQNPESVDINFLKRGTNADGKPESDEEWMARIKRGEYVKPDNLADKMQAECNENPDKPCDQALIDALKKATDINAALYDGADHGYTDALVNQMIQSSFENMPEEEKKQYYDPQYQLYACPHLETEADSQCSGHALQSDQKALLCQKANQARTEKYNQLVSGVGMTGLTYEDQVAIDAAESEVYQNLGRYLCNQTLRTIEDIADDIGSQQGTRPDLSGLDDLQTAMSSGIDTDIYTVHDAPADGQGEATATNLAPQGLTKEIDLEN